MQIEWMNVTLRLFFWHKRHALSTDASRNMLYQVRAIFRHNRWSGAVPHVSNRMKRANLSKKRQNMLCFGVCGCVGERISVLCRQVTSKVPKAVKNLCPLVLELRWAISTWWEENMTLFVFSACYEVNWNWVCGRSRQKMQRSEKEHLFREGCFDGKEYISNTPNKRCSRQVLQLRCSSWYSIKFYT